MSKVFTFPALRDFRNYVKYSCSFAYYNICKENTIYLKHYKRGLNISLLVTYNNIVLIWQARTNTPNSS